MLRIRSASAAKLGIIGLVLIALTCPALTGQSNPFVLSNVLFFPIPPPAPTVTFANASGSPVAVGSGPASVAAGDFNRDGKLDLAVANRVSSSLTILLGNGDGTFASAPLSRAAGHAPASLGVGDFNGDGKLDLAVADSRGNGVAVLLGNGDGTFNKVSFLSGAPGQTWESPWDVALGDFNGDGKLDAAIPNFQANNVTVWLGKGDGAFTPAASSPPAGVNPWKIAVGDFNRDGKLDLAVANQGDSSVTILLGHGDGTFASLTPSLSTSGSAPYAIATADFNRDGKLDLAVSGSSDHLTIFQGNGDGTFTPAYSFVGTEGDPRSLAVGDLNGDGKLDLTITNLNYNDVTILLGNGDGTFTHTASSPTTGNRPISVAMGDFNRDGRLDLAIANDSSNSVSVLLQTSPQPCPCLQPKSARRAPPRTPKP